MEHFQERSYVNGESYVFSGYMYERSHDHDHFAELPDEVFLEFDLVVFNEETHYQETLTLQYHVQPKRRVEKILDAHDGGSAVNPRVILPQFIKEHFKSIDRISAREFIPSLEDIARHA